jgi:zinc protease
MRRSVRPFLRRTCCIVLSPILFLAPFAWLPADDQQQARHIVARAIKAHGGEERLNTLPALTWNETGIYFGEGKSTPYKASFAAHYPGRVKIEVENVYSAVIDGERGWMTTQGQTRDLARNLLDDRREEQYTDWVTTLLPLKHKKFKLALSGDVIVETKSAAGVRVSWKDHSDLNLYFDKGSGLLVKSAQRVKSQERQGHEVSQECIVLEFEDVQGIKSACKTVVRRNGKQFLESTRTDMKRLERLDDSLFVRP